MVTHETYKDVHGKWVLPEEVSRRDGKAVHVKTGEPISVGAVELMSKSKKNVVDPDNIIAAYGADTARWFMLSDTPPERDIEWTAARRRRRVSLPAAGLAAGARGGRQGRLARRADSRASSVRMPRRSAARRIAAWRP